jgi:hypothetical protein
MYAINELMLFVSFLVSTIFGIGNVVCEDQKQYVLRSRRPNLGFDRSSLILGNFPYYRFMFFT